MLGAAAAMVVRPRFAWLLRVIARAPRSTSAAVSAGPSPPLRLKSTYEGFLSHLRRAPPSSAQNERPPQRSCTSCNAYERVRGRLRASLARNSNLRANIPHLTPDRGSGSAVHAGGAKSLHCVVKQSLCRRKSMNVWLKSSGVVDLWALISTRATCLACGSSDSGGV